MRKVETTAFIWSYRHLPVAASVQQAQTMADSGVVDSLAVSAQFGNFVPPQLWTTDNTAMAGIMSDTDSMDDALVIAGYLAAAVPELGTSLLCDAVKFGPAHLTHAMLSLAHVTGGRARFHVGAGEIKNLKPFGYRRSQGIKRLEDLMTMSEQFVRTTDPLNFEGHHTTLDRASIGTARVDLPERWAMGGGPRLVDIATSHCDGLSTAVPCAWGSREAYAEHVSSVRADLSRKNRDPDTFGMGMIVPALIHEDEDVLDRALDNPLVRWVAAMFGRIRQGTWREAGLEPPLPDDWSYHSNFLPQDTTHAFIDEVLGRTTRAHAEAAYLWGSPSSVGKQLNDLVDCGATLVCPADFLPLVLDLDDAAHGAARNIATFEHIKQAEQEDRQ